MILYDHYHSCTRTSHCLPRFSSCTDIFFPAGISLVMLVLLRFFVGVMVWTVVFLVAVGSIAGTGFCWYVVAVRAHVSVCACRWPYSFVLVLNMIQNMYLSFCRYQSGVLDQRDINIYHSLGHMNACALARACISVHVCVCHIVLWSGVCVCVCVCACVCVRARERVRECAKLGLTISRCM